MGAFTIPSIFTAIDKFSSPVKGMGRNLQVFADKADSAIARNERLFRKLTPALSETSKQFLSFASSAAIAGAAIGTASFSVKSLKDYETAVGSFRTIVSDLDDNAFKPYQQMINQVATDTKKSSIDVANSFEKIAGLNSTFADTAEGIGAVSKASIILSKASKDELGNSAENLVGIMNQFSLGAMEADRTINVLAAGQAVGAASITQTAEAFKNFGSTAAGSNITLEESVGLIQTLGKFSIVGAEAGTKLRGAVSKLQEAGVGYTSGQFKMNDALKEAKKSIDKLKTEKEKDAAISKMFGLENKNAGLILLANIKTTEDFTSAVTGTQEAQKAAAINTNTLSNALDEAKSAWINMLTGSDAATNGLEGAKKAVQFVTRNMSTLLKIAGLVVGVFVVWKTVLWASQVAMVAYNIVLGINAALTGQSAFVTAGSTVAYGAFRGAVMASTVAQWLLNTAMLANPVALVVIAVLALVAALGYVIANYKSIESLHSDQLSKNRSKGMQDEAAAVQAAAKSYEKYGNSKEEAQRKALRDAKEILVNDMAGMKVQLAAAKTDSQKRVVENRMATAEGRLMAINQAEAGQAPAGGGTPLLNPKASQNDALAKTINNNNSEKISVDFKNLPAGAEVTGTGNSLDQVMGKVTSTVH